MTWLILFVPVTYIIYTLKLVSSNSRSCDDDPLFTTTLNRLVSLQSPPIEKPSSDPPKNHNKAELKHIMKALEKIQDRCGQRYPALFGSDDRMQACMAELGVPLTKQLGFHQYDVCGNLFGLLAAHPVTPFVSLHHLDVVEPIFPNVTQVEALEHLKIPMKLDLAGLIQQSICYDRVKKWIVSVSWGFAVQVFRGVLSPREIEMPSRMFLNWYRRADYTA